MKKKIVISAIVLAGICALLGVGYMTLSWAIFGTPWELEDVQKEAQQYLNQKYSCEMIADGAIKSLSTGEYTVYAYRKIPSIYFTVEVALDYSDISDNYYKRYFEEQVSNSFEKYTNTIYENSSVYISFYYNMQKLLDDGINEGIINEETKLEETDIMKKGTSDYNIFITGELVTSDSEKIYEIVQHILYKGYDVERVTFVFTDKTDKNDEAFLFFGKHDYEKIIDSDSIVPYINEAITDKED